MTVPEPVHRLRDRCPLGNPGSATAISAKYERLRNAIYLFISKFRIS